VSYRNLCACIRELRRRDPDGDCETAPPTTRESGSPATVKRPAIGGEPQVDPLANVRRLTEERRPGFHYCGTLPEKDLFGE
jgi:hypothetical protein